MFINSVQQLQIYYPDLSIDDLKVTWSKRYHSRFLIQGFKFCGECRVMIRIEEELCRMCGKKFRMRTRKKNWRAINVF